MEFVQSKTYAELVIACRTVGMITVEQWASDLSPHQYTRTAIAREAVDHVFPRVPGKVDPRWVLAMLTEKPELLDERVFDFSCTFSEAVFWGIRRLIEEEITQDLAQHWNQLKTSVAAE